MSNPGVIVLDSAACKGTQFRRFQIEDNIGECIHIHIDNMRIDLSIDQFLQFTDSLKQCLSDNSLLGHHGLLQLDPAFLKTAARYLPFVEDVTDEVIEINELQFIVSSKKLGSDWLELRDICNTPAHKYLSGNPEEFINYNQINYHGVDNVSRLVALKKSIEINGFDASKSSIVLFGDSNRVRDGQHRAAVIAFLHGSDTKIPVKRIRFRDGLAIDVPILRQNIKTVIRALTKRFYRKIRDLRR